MPDNLISYFSFSYTISYLLSKYLKLTLHVNILLFFHVCSATYASWETFITLCTHPYSSRKFRCWYLLGSKKCFYAQWSWFKKRNGNGICFWIIHRKRIGPLNICFLFLLFMNCSEQIYLPSWPSTLYIMKSE